MTKRHLSKSPFSKLRHMLPRNSKTVAVISSLHNKTDVNFKLAQLFIKRTRGKTELRTTYKMSKDQINENAINHAERPLENMEKLFMTKEYADVTFIVQGKSLLAHRCVLAIGSEYFRVLLFGNFAESNKKEIELNVNLEAFKVMLKYIYTGVITVSDYDDALRIELVNLASEYGILNLVTELLEYMSQSLTLDNCLLIMNLANLHSVESVYAKTMTFVDTNAFDILQHESFLTLSKELIVNIIKRDSFSINEVLIFNAVVKWSKNNPEDVIESVLAHVRFVLMQIFEIEKFVEPVNVLDPHEVEAIKQQIISLNCLPHRDGNIHRSNMDCQLTSKMGTGYNWEISSVNLKGAALFELENESVVNHIAMTLSEMHTEATSYYVEVSCDRRKWKRVIDYTKNNCYRGQYLYFDLQRVKYIYVSSGNVKDPNFDIKNFVIDYMFYDVPILIDGFVALKSPLKESIFLSGETFGCRFIPSFSNSRLRFPQPFYINCVYMECSDSEHLLEFVETSLDGIHFKKIRVKQSHSESFFFFEAHAANCARLIFTKSQQEIKEKEVAFFFQPGDINLFTLKET